MKLSSLLALVTLALADTTQRHTEPARRKGDRRQPASLLSLQTGLEEVPALRQVPKVPTPEVPKTPRFFPVPVASQCIVIITCQYIIIYTALALVRTYCEFRGQGKGVMENALRSAVQTQTYGPMICVLFIACRMRVESLSDGKDQPQEWVQSCMYTLTSAAIASTLLALLMPLVTGKPLALKEGTYDIEKPQQMELPNKTAFFVLAGIRYLILLGTYGGLIGIIVGIFSYTPPGIDSVTDLPPVEPAIMCTTVLVVIFFLTQLVIAACSTFTEFVGMEFPKLVGIMRGAANTVEYAPMLSILFLAARMRALQHNSQPQAWAQHCMYTATGALILTTLLSIAVPLYMNGTMYISPKTKEVIFEVPEPRIGWALMMVRLITTFVFYGAALAVAISIATFEAPGNDRTLPVSPTVQCVVNLTCQYFFICGCMAIMVTISELSSGTIPLETYTFFSALDSAKQTVALAPMLAILFVTTRMYALLITDGKGAPQAWVQDGMYMATWAVFVSFWSCLMTGFFIGDVETDEDGNVVTKFSNKYFAAFMTAIRYLTMLLLYGGVGMVVVGLFVMTPKTANGRGSIPVVSHAVGATPLARPPPGPNNVA